MCIKCVQNLSRSQDLLGEPQVQYEVLKLALKNTWDNAFANAKHLLRGSGVAEALPFDLERCEALSATLDVDTVPPKEICTIRQLAELGQEDLACYEVTIFTAMIFTGVEIFRKAISLFIPKLLEILLYPKILKTMAYILNICSQ